MPKSLHLAPLGASCAVIAADIFVMTGPSVLRRRIVLDAERGSGTGTAAVGTGGSLRNLLAKRGEIRDKMGAIIAKAESDGPNGRELTAEELTAFDALKAEIGALEPRILRLEEQSAAEIALAAPRPTVAGGVPQLDQVRRGAEAKTQFASVGEFLHAVRFNPNDQRLDFHAGVGGDAATAGLSAEMRMDDGAAGGFALPVQFRSELLMVKPQEAVVRPRATVIPPGSPPDGPVSMPALDQTGNAPGNVFGGVQVNWIAEGAEKPMTDMKLREITLTPHEVAGLMQITDKLLRNWQASGPLINDMLRKAIYQAEDFAFLNANGVGKPLGFLKAGAAYHVARLAAGQVQYLDLIEMMARVWDNGGDPVWCYSKSVLPQLMTLRNPNGQYIWSPSAVTGAPNTLLGRGAIESNRNPILGTYGDIWLADLSAYLIKDGSGPFVAASEHVLFTQNKTVIKAFWNVDGSPWLTAPMQLENGWQASPFVGLDVPAPQ